MAGLGAAYANAISGMMGAPSPKPGATPQAAVGPKFPGGPPPPTGIGAMDTGDSMTPRAQVQTAIMSLRKVADSYPSMSDRIEGIIAELKSGTSDSGKPTSETMDGDEMPPPSLPPLPMPSAAPGGAPQGGLPPLPM